MAPRVPPLADLAVPGTQIAVRVTPGARRAEVRREDGQLRISVTEIAEDGRANRAVQQALAKAMGVARTRLTLVRGATARDKLFRLD